VEDRDAKRQFIGNMSWSVDVTMRAVCRCLNEAKQREQLTTPLAERRYAMKHLRKVRLWRAPRPHPLFGDGASARRFDEAGRRTEDVERPVATASCRRTRGAGSCFTAARRKASPSNAGPAMKRAAAGLEAVCRTYSRLLLRLLWRANVNPPARTVKLRPSVVLRPYAHAVENVSRPARVVMRMPPS
jgi:hypothetical protein